MPGDHACPSADPAACVRYQNYLTLAGFVGQPLSFASICVPHDCPYYDPDVPCEKLAFGPPWLWVHGFWGKFGWRTPAVHHLLYVEKFWARHLRHLRHFCHYRRLGRSHLSAPPIPHAPVACAGLNSRIKRDPSL